MAPDTATILEIQRMSTEDGPGIRTTVFLKGCTLACTWCHNPESISPRPQLIWHAPRCLGCRGCVEACPTGARTLGEAGAEVASSCKLCGACVEACPTLAIERLGSVWTVSDLFSEVGKDRAYFEASGGGVTVSGGEPACQEGFAASFLTRCREARVHTALDTCGMCDTESLLRLAELADMVLYDLKEIDPERHRRFTGRSNEVVLRNLIELGTLMSRSDRPSELWVRTPLIPGATATDANVAGIGAFLAENLGGELRRWELCAFNNLCGDKYRRLGRAWPFAETSLLSEAELRRFERLGRAAGVPPDRVIATGPTRVEPRAAG